MTIGIAASGRNAGLAVFRALAAVERVATGAIGGFATFAAIGADGRLHRASTQRGGTRTLFTAGETTGVAPPPEVAAATRAAVMSSGPDRPVPLDQFVTADTGAGLVTGHRLPNAAGVTGVPVNVAVLERLRAGDDAKTAVEAVLGGDPEADAGVIAVDREGRLHAHNSARAARRPDLGHARRENHRAGAVVEILHNAIEPHGALAALAAEIALAVLAPAAEPTGSVTVRAGTPLTRGDRPRVHVDGDGIAQRIETTDARLLDGEHNCAAIYLGADVVQDGRVLGRTLYEPNAVVANGIVLTLSGQSEIAIGYRLPEDEP